MLHTQEVANKNQQQEPQPVDLRKACIDLVNQEIARLKKEALSEDHLVAVKYERERKKHVKVLWNLGQVRGWMGG